MHTKALDPSASYRKIIRYIHQLDIQDRERDNPHRAGPENRMYPTGHLDVGCWFLEVAVPLIIIAIGNAHRGASIKIL